MDTLANQFDNLPADKRRMVHLCLGKSALRKWREYCSVHRRIGYVESVCGTHQSVDAELPADAWQAAFDGCDHRNVANRYRESIAAMQDGDLLFPEPIEFAYYALYTLFRKYAVDNTVDDWLIVSQALSTEEEEANRLATLESAIRNAA